MNQQQLMQIFQSIDQDRSGSLNAIELQQVLKNGLSTQFNQRTVELMIGMFDFDRNKTISFNEFCQLFNYVQSWMAYFRRYDRDGSGTISVGEMKQALTDMNYRFSDNFVQFLIFKFDRTQRGQVAFDDFILACICLQTLTRSFARYDYNRNGHATFPFEDFLVSALSIL